MESFPDQCSFFKRALVLYVLTFATWIATYGYVMLLGRKFYIVESGE